MLILQGSGKLQTALGYQWKYYNNDISNIYPTKNFKLYKRKVLQYSKDNEYLNSFNSLREAASTLTNDNLKVKTIANQIGQACKGNRRLLMGIFGNMMIIYNLRGKMLS